MTFCDKCAKRFKKNMLIFLYKNEYCCNKCIKNTISEENRIKLGKSYSDVELRFTNDYNESNKEITDEQFNELKLINSKIHIERDELKYKILVRDRIWEYKSSLYIYQMSLISKLDYVLDKFRIEMMPYTLKFVELAIDEFNENGFLYKGKWASIEKILTTYGVSLENKVYCYEDLEFADKIKFRRARESFRIWFNKKNNIIEDDE